MVCALKNSCAAVLSTPYLLLVGAVCSLMTRYCQPKGQLQPSSDLAGGEGTHSPRREKNDKLRALFINYKKVEHHPELIITDDEFVRHWSKEWVSQFCEGPRLGPYLYFEATDIYRLKPSLEPFHEFAEDVVNKYNSERRKSGSEEGVEGELDDHVFSHDNRGVG